MCPKLKQGWLFNNLAETKSQITINFVFIKYYIF